MTPSKTPFHLLDFDFLAAMAENMRKGLTEGREEHDWYKIEPTQKNIEEYFSAAMRHLMKGVPGRGGEREALAAVACNAMIMWYLVGACRED